MRAVGRVLAFCAAGAASLAMVVPPVAHATKIPAVVLRSSVSVHKVVALTFDDGPSPYSLQVLALLRRYDAHATFFLVGTRISAFRDVAREEEREGDLLGNHTYSHADLEWLSSRDVRWEMERAQEEIHAATGATAHWFRPPYGAVNAQIASIAASQGMHTVTWSVDPQDWSMPGVRAIVERVADGVEPGSIVLMHDGGGPRFETVAALAELLPLLKARGYRFITLDEMFFPERSTGHGNVRRAARR